MGHIHEAAKSFDSGFHFIALLLLAGVGGEVSRKVLDEKVNLS
jgi:hypothetical protein